MRKIGTVLFVLLLAWPLAAQQRTGNIYGTVVDKDQNPLPGVTITLTQTTIAAMTTITTAEGRFRFMSLFPGSDYVLKAELSGFKPLTQTGVIVSVGSNSEIKLIMEMGKLEEQVTVTAVTPVVETKKTAVTASMNYQVMQSLPSARDPWVILQMTPAVQVDRENVGGNESGQQSYFVSKGGDATAQSWTMDGVNISDPAAVGASPTYFDFDIFEELQVTTGGADVETQVSGVSLNMVTRRGGSRLSLGGRFYLADEKFQATITPEKIASLGVPGYNRVIETKDFGFNVGGPLIKDKVWWWGSYGIQDIKTTVIAGSRDDTLLTNLAAKVNFQLIPQNRAEVFLHAGKKEKFGRSSSTVYPPGWYQRGKYHFGSPIIKFQDEHMFGDKLFLSFKYGFTDAGFGMWPMGDQKLQDMAWYDVENDLVQNSNTWFFSGRPNQYMSFNATLFMDNFLGASHEIKFGGEYNDRNIDYASGYPGNMSVNQNYNTQTVDWDGDGTKDVVKTKFGIDIKKLQVYSAIEGQYGTKAYAGWLSDTISTGRFNFKLGLRYDRQEPWVGALASKRVYTQDRSDSVDMANYYEILQKYLTPDTITKIAAVFPDKSAPAVTPDFKWENWSPRIGVTWDIFGDGKTLAKLSGSIYGQYMGIIGGRWGYGGLGGEVDFWWVDANKDNKVDWRELYWANCGISTRPVYKVFNDAGNFVGNWAREQGTVGTNATFMWTGFNYQDPGAIEASYTTVDPNWSANRTQELLLTLEREVLSDLGVGLDLTYRKYDRFAWRPGYYPTTDHKITKDDYMVAGTIPATLTLKTGAVISTEEAAGKPWYVLKSDIKSTYYTYQTHYDSERYNTYIGVDLRANKRLSNKWMANGSFSLGLQRSYYGKYGVFISATDADNPTNIWAYEGEPYAYDVGAGSGKLSQPLYTLWMCKLQALYQLPLDIDVSFTLTGRQGWVVPVTATLNDSRIKSILQAGTIQLSKWGNRNRLPNMWTVNARVQKVLKALDRGRIYLMVDIFNPFNFDTINRRRAISYGTFYLATNTNSPTARSGENNEVLNPRIFRFGVRFEF